MSTFETTNGNYQEIYFSLEKKRRDKIDTLYRSDAIRTGK